MNTTKSLSRWFLVGSIASLASAACGEAKDSDVVDTGGMGGAGSGTGAQAGTGATSGGGSTAGVGGAVGGGGSGTSGAGGQNISGSGGAVGGGGAGGTPNGGATGGDSGGSSGSGGTPLAGSGGGGNTGNLGGGGAGDGGASGGEAGTANGNTGNVGVATDCTISAPSTLGEIETVGVIDWTTDLQGASSAEIHYGLDTSYGLVAPADPASPHTLLLGMKPEREYHYEVVVSNGTETCSSGDLTLTTGPLPNGTPQPYVDGDSAGTYEGFIVTSSYSGGWALILDKDLDVVWAYKGPSDMSRARMTYDGLAMWMVNASVPEGSGNNRVVRVGMDGSGAEDLSSEFPRLNHDFTVLPDESVVFIAYGNGCDDVMRHHPDGTTELVVNSWAAQGGNGMGTCHLNAIHYVDFDETIMFSDLDHDTYTKVDLDGNTVWVLNGSAPRNDFSGFTWDNQHGFHALSEDRLLIFNNGARGGSGTKAIELELDATAGSVSNVWEFGDPALSNDVMGDVQRLSNGNTLVTYSFSGYAVEVDQQSNVLREYGFSLGNNLGYAQARDSLYGPPPR